MLKLLREYISQTGFAVRHGTHHGPFNPILQLSLEARRAGTVLYGPWPLWTLPSIIRIVKNKENIIVKTTIQQCKRQVHLFCVWFRRGANQRLQKCGESSVKHSRENTVRHS